MRAFRFVSLVLVAVGVLCATEQADAGSRRSKMRIAYAPFPPPADKAKSGDKKADSAPATKPSTDKPSTDKPPVDKKAEAILKAIETPQATTRRRGLFKRRYVTQATTPAAPVVLANTSA